MRLPIAIILTLTACVASIAQASNGATALRVRELLQKYAGADDMLYEERAARDALVAIGPSALPALREAFQENVDQYYRSAVVNAMYAIDRDGKETEEFLARHLARDPAQWGKPQWVIAAMTGAKDRSSATRFALRALVLENQTFQLMALSLLRNRGGAEALPGLEAFLKARKATASTSAGVDGVALLAEDAAAAIRSRERSSLDAKEFDSVGSFADVDKRLEALRDRLDEEDVQLLQMADSHIRAYLNARGEFDEQMREALFLALVRNKSPRELIVLGFFLHSMALERSMASPTIRSEDDSPEYRASLLKEIAERREAALRVVSRYLQQVRPKDRAAKGNIQPSKPTR